MYFIDRALATFLSQLAGDPQTFPDDGVKRAELQTFKPALWYGRAVGGASLHCTANYWRLREIDFIERSRIPRRRAHRAVRQARRDLTHPRCFCQNGSQTVGSGPQDGMPSSRSCRCPSCPLTFVCPRLPAVSFVGVHGRVMTITDKLD